MKRFAHLFPFFLMPLAMLSLVLGIITGWYRLGFRTLDALPNGNHGALMIGCFLGGLIMLERAVSIGKSWAFAGSLLCGISALLFIGEYTIAARVGMTVAAAFYVFILVRTFAESRNTASGILVLGGFCLLTGNMVLLIRDLYPLSVNWWIAFLLFTILGERLSLNNAVKGKNLVNMLLVGLLFAGLLLPFHSYGSVVFGIALVILGIWLLLSESFSGQHVPYRRYMLLAFIFGSFWLMATGSIMLAGGFYYDAQLHGFYVGFVFSMIFAHAPMMIRRVFKIDGEYYHPVQKWLLFFLQAGIIARVSGSLGNWENLIRWGGFANGLVILIFMFVLGWRIFVTRRKKVLAK